MAEENDSRVSANFFQQTSSHSPTLPSPSASTAPVFCLRLPDHQTELHQFVGQLFNDDCLTDVTLSLDDGQTIKAHRLVLCAFSSYFRQVLTRVTVPYHYPVIIVKDVSFVDLKALLEYIYKGQVMVSNERLPFVLKCARQLKIRGLFELREDKFMDGRTNGAIESNDREYFQTHINFNRSNSNNSNNFDNETNPNGTKMRREDDRESHVSEESGVCMNEVVDSFSKKSAEPFSVSLAQENALPKLPFALDLSSGAKRFISQTNLCVSRTFAPPFNLNRSISVDDNQFGIVRYNDVPTFQRFSSQDDSFVHSNIDYEDRREKKRNMNIFHAARYRSRKKAKIDALYDEEVELQRKSAHSRMHIDKLESAILNLIGQQTKKIENSETIFMCPVCKNVQKDAAKLRSHINLLHNDTESLMKFLMINQPTPSFVPPAINSQTSVIFLNPAISQ